MLAKHLINDKGFSIIQLYEEWPYLFKREYFLKHANMLMEFNVQEKWRQQLIGTVPKLVQLFRSDTNKKYIRTKDLMEAIEKTNEEVQSKMAEECSLLQSLLKHFKEEENLIIKYFEVSDNFSD